MLSGWCWRAGAILTKMDGDSRGGAALSVKAVSGKPIKFVGAGEKLEALEPFYPDRLTSRILGEQALPPLPTLTTAGTHRPTPATACLRNPPCLRSCQLFSFRCLFWRLAIQYLHAPITLQQGQSHCNIGLVSAGHAVLTYSSEALLSPPVNSTHPPSDPW